MDCMKLLLIFEPACEHTRATLRTLDSGMYFFFFFFFFFRFKTLMFPGSFFFFLYPTLRGLVI